MPERNQIDTVPVPQRLRTKGSVALIAASMLTVMAGATISPALPKMADYFSEVDSSGFLVKLVVTITALSIALSAPVLGWLSDRIERSSVLKVSVVVYAIAGSAGLWIDDLSALMVSRVILGIAVAGVMTSSTALISEWFTGERRSKMFGFQAAASGLGGAVFLSLGGALAVVSWNAPFAIYFLSLPVAILVAWKVTDPPPVPKVAAELKPVLKSNATALISGIVVLAFVIQIVFYVVPTQLPFLLGEMGGDSSITGLVIGWMVLVQALSSLSYRWVSRLGFSNVALLSLTLMSAGMTIVGTSGAIAQVLVGLSISALGVGLVMPNLNSWISDNTSSATRARAIGALISAMFLGQFVSPVIAEPVIQGGDTAPAFLAAGVLSLVAAITVLALSVAKIAQSDSASP
ncbi:MFS transporter [Cryobacterium luteum]|uniref:MFS transporter n=1 Tax=Cryobacterium luteum TaxID=1424661 RepID=A0A1H8M154_9MICO|nr:MFS transporter [Cryobacterium luteum]TFB92247.1 MFS transporter [Cryobacterium luteum]SEO11122.1 Predicted arabinose efflux permease, MFS family [Cryobacterium luteum]